MCYSQLSMLNEILSKDKIEALADYFCSLNDNTKTKITTMRIMQVLCIDSKKAMKVLMMCKKNGILKISYGIRCPECGFLIKTLDDFPYDLSEFSFCYQCEEEIDIGPEDVELVFTLKTEPVDFMKGQRPKLKKRYEYVNEAGAAPKQSMKSFIDAGVFNVNHALYSPSKLEYEKLKTLYEKVFIAKKSSDKGNSLEEFTAYLMNLVKCFNASPMRTRTNQLDCTVRNTFLSHSGTFEFIGGRFVIECKNEKKTPSGTYMSKLHDIISNINNETGIMRFGMIISKEQPPKTFDKLANKYYLRHKVVVISFGKSDLSLIVDKHKNLLDLIDEKCTSIIMDSTTDLEKAGLY